MNSPGQRAPLRHLDHPVRSLRTRREKRPAAPFIAVIAVTLTVLPLSACSDGGGSIIRSWFLKQDGVEKVKTSCETHDETGCHAIATTTLSDETEPDKACAILNQAATELPRLDKIKEDTAYIQLTWKHHGTVLVFDKQSIRLYEETNPYLADNQKRSLEAACDTMETTVEHSGGTAERITQSYDTLTIERGDEKSVPSDVITQPLPTKDGQRLDTEDTFRIGHWDIRAHTGKENTTETLPTSLISDILALSIPEAKDPGISITANALISDKKTGFEVDVRGLGPYNPDGPDQGTTRSVLSTIERYPTVSSVNLCTARPKNNAQRCKEYTLKNGEFVTTSS